MKAYGRGILSDSQIIFNSPSKTARQLFLYPLCVGRYNCSNEYIVKRNNYDSFLIMYVIQGTCFINEHDSSYSIKAGEFALINCYHPHSYGSNEGCKLLWVHFDGPMAKDYYSYIRQREHRQPADPAIARRHIERLIDVYESHKPSGEALISKYLMGLLTEFMIDYTSNAESTMVKLDYIRSYIVENLHRDLTVEELANRANLSVYYFIRRFKQEFGCTPHRFLLNTRIETAKFLLKSSELTILEITYKCGFTSQSNFCTCFKKTTGLSPAAYRSSGG